MSNRELIKAVNLALGRWDLNLSANGEVAQLPREVAYLLSQAQDALSAYEWRDISEAVSGDSYIVQLDGVIITATRLGTHWMSRGEEVFPRAIIPLPKPITGEL